MTKTFRKKPLEVQAWVFPDTMTEQFELSRELQSHGVEIALYDYAVEKTDTPFKDGASWRWFQAHIPGETHSNIARIGDMIILDPVTGWGVLDSELFAQAYEEETEEEND